MVLDLTGLIIIFTILWVAILYLSSRYRPANMIIYPLLLVIRSERLTAYFTKLGGRMQRFLLLLSDLLISVASAMMIIFPIILIINETMTKSEIVSTDLIKVYNGDTFFIIIVSLAFALLIHESFHALIISANGLKPSSIGLILIAFIPIFFTEVDDAEYEKLPKIRKLRIISSGSAANLLLVFFLLPILLSLPFLLSPVYVPTDGALVISVQSGSPASEVGIVEGDVISHVYILNSLNVAVEGFKITTARDLANYISSLPISTNLLLNVSGRSLILSTVPSSNGSQIGVSLDDNYSRTIDFAPLLLPYFLKSFLSWLINFNITLGFINLLVFPRSDGEQFLREFVSGLKFGNYIFLFFRYIVTPLSVILLLKSIF